MDVNSKSAVVVVVGDDGELKDGPDRLAPAADHDEGAQLSEFLERVYQHLRHLQAQRVILTAVSERNSTPSAIRKKAKLESCIQLAAHKTGASVETIHQKSIGKALGLGSNASKTDIRSAAEANVGAQALSPEPDRRSRALAAAWAAATEDSDGLR
jgi:hypothetical protein